MVALLASRIVDLSIVELGELLLHCLEPLCLCIRVALCYHLEPLALVPPSSGWQIVEEALWQLNLLLLDLTWLDVGWEVVLLKHGVLWINGGEHS